MVNWLAFNVGCLPLVPNLDGEVEGGGVMDAKWWEERLSKGLSSLNSATKVDVHVSGIGVRIPRPNDPLLSDGEYDVDFVPGPAEGSYYVCELLIPERYRAEIAPYLAHAPLGERFRVETRFGSAGPVTFVNCIDDPGVDWRQALQVMLVREYLKRELAKAGGMLTVETVGPSPFWANFSVWRGEASTYEWSKPGRGYDEVLVTDVRELHETRDALMADITEPLSLFYAVQRSWHRRLKRSRMVTAMASELIEMHSSRGAQARLVRLFKSGSNSRSLLIAAITSRMIDTAELAGDKKMVEEATPGKFFGEELRDKQAEAASRTYVDDIDSAQALANMLESSRKVDFEVAVVASSTLLGAVAGAVAALLAG